MLSRLFKDKTSQDDSPAEAVQPESSFEPMVESMAAAMSFAAPQNNSLLNSISDVQMAAQREAMLAQQAPAQARAGIQYRDEPPQASAQPATRRENSSRNQSAQIDRLADALAQLKSQMTSAAAPVEPATAQAANQSMVQASAPHHGQAVSGYSYAPPEPSLLAKYASFNAIVGQLLRSWWLIIFCALAGLVLAALYSLSLPNKYESIAEILIEPREQRVIDNAVMQDGLNREATVADAESQVRIISSSSVIDPVIEELELYNDPEFNGRDAGLGPFTLLKSLLVGDEQNVSDDRASAKKYLYENFFVMRVNQTFTIRIGVSTRNPEKSARIANAIAQAYMDEKTGARSSAAGDANKGLTSRLDELRDLLRRSEEKVETYRAENGLLDADGKLISEVQLSRLNEQLALAKVQSGDAKIRAELAADADLADVISGSLPSAIASPASAQLRVEYSRAKSRLDRIATKLGERHPDRIAAEAELRSARTAIAQEIGRIVSSAQEDFKRAIAREDDLQSRFNTLRSSAVVDNAAKVKLRELNREVEANRRVYESFLLRSRETGEQQNIQANNVRLISEAVPISEKIGPSRKLITAIGGSAGGILGALLSLLPLMIGGLRELGHQVKNAPAGGQAYYQPEPAAAPTQAQATGGDLYDNQPAHQPVQQLPVAEAPMVQSEPPAPVPAPVAQQAAHLDPAPPAQPVAQAQPQPAQMQMVPQQMVFPGFAQGMAGMAPAPAQAHPQAQAQAQAQAMMQPQPVMMQPPMMGQPMMQPVYMQASPQPNPTQMVYTAWSEPPKNES